MKQKIHYLFMLLLMLVVGVGGAKADSYKKITSEDELTEGQYLIVYVGTTSSDRYALTGSGVGADKIKLPTKVSISNDEIDATNAMNRISLTIAKDDKAGYSLKTASGYYIYNTSSSKNGFKASENLNTANSYKVTISFDKDGNADITSAGSYLRYNDSNAQNILFSYYNYSTYTNQKPIKLFKKVESGPSVEATTLTIDDTGITNTDVYKGTAAGSLSATVKDASGNAVSGATVAWESRNPSVATIDENGTVTLVAAGTTTITATYAGEDGQYEGSSDNYTLIVTNSTPATLPFNWEGGISSELNALNGVTTNDLGSDYAKDHAPYYVKFDGNGDYIQVKTDGQPGKVSIGVKMIGGANTSSITVQGSSDGEIFKDIETLSISGTQNKELTLETTKVFAENDRYVRLVFTKGSNVGVGPISIAKPLSKHVATFYINGESSTAEIAEGSAITFPAAPDDINGKSFVGWTTVPINGTLDTAPETLVTSATMGNADVTYYAVYAAKEGEGVSNTATLTNADIVAAGDGKDGYNDWTITDSNDRKWNAHAIKNQHSKATSEYHYLQIKKSSDSEQCYIQVPEMGGTITAMTMTVSGSSQPMTGGSNSSTLFFSNSNLTSAAGNGVVSDGGASTVTLDCYSLGLSTGYITSSGAVRIWDVKVTYGTPATYSGYCTTVVAPVKPAKPIVFHDGGEGVSYEGELTVPMFAEEGATIYYTTDGSEPDVQNAEQAYSGPVSLPVGETTVKAIAVKNGMASDVVEKVYTIDPVQAPDIVDLDGYYSIQNYKGNYVNVAGRKTVTFVEDNSDKAGTVIKVKTTNGEVDVLRSQGVDVPGYAERAMNYVDDIISLAVEKLELQNLLGSTGEQTILEKFHDAFDYHLHLEQPAENKYRIYGKTPSMKHVVDFYAENKDKVDAKLPMMEERINYAINKVLEKVGRGLSLKDQFNIHRIWDDMNVEGLTEPVEGDDAAIARFYEEVLSSEAKVWLFAYEAAMYYVNFVEGKESFLELKAQYPEYFKYWDKAKRVLPDFKYYIVSNTEGNGIDFISEGNEDIKNNAERTIWTLGQREKFKVSLGVSTTKTVYPVSQDGKVESYTENYTTLNTDFAYTLPEDVTAYQITGVGEVKDNETMGTVLKQAITGTIPAQTPVLLMAKEKTAELLLAADASALSGNELYGNEYLIEKDQLKHTVMKTVFETIKKNFGDELYDRYVAEYEHLMLLNSGTVNNKYFFNLSKANDLVESGSYNEGKVMVLGQDDDLGIRFHFANKEDLIGNEAFMFDDTNKLDDIVLTLRGDINRDGIVSIADVTALVNIILGKAKYPDDADKYDFEAANVNGDQVISIADVTALVNIILGKDKAN